MTPHILTAREILLAAKIRLKSPSKWISYWSISEDGKRLSADMAILWAGDGESFEQRFVVEPSPVTKEAMRLMADETGINPLWTDQERVAYFNDGGTHRRIMAAFDRAIAKAEKETP